MTNGHRNGNSCVITIDDDEEEEGEVLVGTARRAAGGGCHVDMVMGTQSQQGPHSNQLESGHKSQRPPLAGGRAAGMAMGRGSASLLQTVDELGPGGGGRGNDTADVRGGTSEDEESVYRGVLNDLANLISLKKKVAPHTILNSNMILVRDCKSDLS